MTVVKLDTSSDNGKTGNKKTGKGEPAESLAVPAANDPAETAKAVSPALVAYEDRMAPIEALIQNIVQRTLLPGLTFLICIVAWVSVKNVFAPDLPGPLETWQQAMEIFAEPFYVYGPNDMGIGWQVLYSLGRVLAGFALATLVGIPVGFVIGLSDVFARAWQPLIKILRPVSPLAWLPIGLLIFKAVNPSAIFVIFITSIWPVIINTAAGVRNIPQDYMNVASVLNLGRLEITRKILMPATLPYILTGMQLSLSTAWMVIVAAEMLTGGIGIGFYIWDEWNNLNAASIIVAILIIGLVGIVLEAIMNALQRRFSYTG